MIREIRAKVLLAHVRQPDDWFGLRYNMNLYRGCQHRCIYCDSRSLCYGIENFDGDVLVKANAIDLLRRELPSKRVKGMIGTGSMNDPYMPAEKQVRLMERALAVIAEFGFPVHVLTKSDLVRRDVDVLRVINRVHAVVSFTVTTADDELARRIEPGAPPPSRRFAALAELAGAGIHTGVLLMPVLPLIEDDAANIRGVIEGTAAHGAEYVLPGMGMTLRDRQRAYYYDRLDRHFPGLRAEYERRFGDRYHAPARDEKRLYALVEELCARHGLATAIPRYPPESPAQQLPLL
ncbi:MAG: radical SAM protein [Anaerolineae bacterium]|nr:radical SAM protein [Anaerolineae bacterium]